jgi:CheY-like chemotaxis protein
MTETQIGRLFEKFTRFNIFKNRTTVGTGLGMSITKHLVDLMDGDISVQSEKNKGTVFTVRIPQKTGGKEVCGIDFEGKLRDFYLNSPSAASKTRFMREYMPYGSVLVVDDVESNLYVAKGMLMPYGLKIETAASGFEAIEKIKNGNSYDIIFMDHMMPEMNGIETVKILRDIGYENTIVALTANTLAGQTDIFLQNGFDDFISKPIDSRELNQKLNELIRNKKSKEVIEKARKEQCQKNTDTNDQKKTITKEMQKYFIRDAENAVTLLNKINLRSIDGKEMDSYIITVHGIKSALANIDEKELSAMALKLEQAGRERNKQVILEDTHVFLDALRSLIKTLKSQIPEGVYEKIKDTDIEFLRKQLHLIKSAFAAFDKKQVKEILASIRQKSWSCQINNGLDDISIHLLHSEFEKAQETIDRFILDYLSPSSDLSS